MIEEPICWTTGGQDSSLTKVTFSSLYGAILSVQYINASGSLVSVVGGTSSYGICGCVTSGSGSSPDADFFAEGTVEPPTAITQSIYTYGDAGFGTNAPNAGIDLEDSTSVAFRWTQAGSTLASFNKALSGTGTSSSYYPRLWFRGPASTGNNLLIQIHPVGTTYFDSTELFILGDLSGGPNSPDPDLWVKGNTYLVGSIYDGQGVGGTLGDSTQYLTNNSSGETEWKKLPGHAYGEWYVLRSNPDTITFAGGSTTPQKVSAKAVEGLTSDFTYATGRLTYTGTDTIVKHVMVSTSLSLTEANVEVSGWIYENGAVVLKSEFDELIDVAGGFNVGVASALIEFAPNDYVEFFVAPDTHTGDDDLTIQNLNFAIKP